ncbi:MAG: SH3 domain-containing protein [Oscillospiraceae bacterium]|nr:SH3 domain-containing protein [Oscillospiraceae bacterium]
MHKKAKKVKFSKFFSVGLSALLLSGCLTFGASAAEPYGAGQVAISDGSLNVRSAASTASHITGSLEKDSYVTLLEKSGGWWKVRYNGGQGWCSGSYITVLDDETARIKLDWGTLNVRRGPGTGYSVKATLKNGDTVCPLWETNGWSRILYNGSEVGWVNSSYLSGDSSASSPAAAVSLDVPYFSQVDNRWRYMKLGSSSNTVGAQGCALTSLSMCQSWRHGYDITPADMLGQLKFTSGGALYLPSDYECYYASDYLEKIKEQLAQNKPVIVAAKTSRGSQHWVVVTGYSGGSGAVSFTINDPGASARETLADFFADYPIFYKIAYYR